jgi:hypothetical protein
MNGAALISMAKAYSLGSNHQRAKEEAIMKDRKRTIIVIGLLMAIGLVFTSGIALAEDNVTGTVLKTEAGLVLEAVDGTYLIVGQDLSDMVGKKIKATGTISEGKAGKTIEVMAVEEIKE